MESYTQGSLEHLRAIERKQLESNDKYPLELTHSDFLTVVRALWLSSNGSSTYAEEASSLLSSIGETLGVEGI